MPQALRSVGDRKSSVEMLVYPHRATGQGRSPAHRFDLQAEMLKAHSVVPIHGPLKLQAENQVQVLTSPRQKCCSTFRRAHLKAAIELLDVVFPQKLIRLLHADDAVQSQLLRQAPLPGPEVTLAAAARLRRVGRNHLNP